MEKYVEQLTSMIVEYGPRLLGAIVVLLIGLQIIKIIVRNLNKLFEKSNIDISLKPFLKSLISILLKVLLIISVMGMVGIEMTSFIAILGAAGLAIGLALQGSLSNFAGGVLILLFKPFKVSDVIVAQGHTGVVQKIDILYTHMTTFDNKEIIIPNGALANSDVINMSTQPTRRADFNVGVAYGTNIKKAREIVLSIFENDERALKDPAPVVYLNNFGDSSLDLVVRVWANASDLWPMYFDGMEKINEEFEKNGIEIPFPQRVVHQAK